MVDYSFIADASPAPAAVPYNPLGMATQIQQLQNLQTTNKLDQQQLTVRQSELGNSQRLQMAQQFSALASPGLVPDEQVVPIARSMLSTAVRNGLNPALAAQYGQMLDSGDIAQIRQAAHIGMLGQLHGQEQISNIVGGPDQINSGQQVIPGMRGGAYSAQPGGFQPSGQPVQVQSSPEFREGLERVYEPGVGWVYKQKQQIPTGPGSTGQNGAGTSTTGGGGGGGSGSTGTGAGTTTTTTTQSTPRNLSEPEIGTKEDIAQNISKYNEDQQAISQHVQNVQSLTKAHDALEMVGTGVGTPKALAILRSYATGLMTSTGFRPAPKVDLQNASADILDKYLTDYARQSALGGGTNLDTLLAGKSNASGATNPLAARSVINTNIGRERLAVAAALENTNPRTYITDRGAFFAQHDPEGAAADMLTKDELRAKIAHMSDADRRKYNGSVEMANKYKLLSMGRQNQYRGGSTEKAYPPSVDQQ